ncbi:MAG: hypothetical protein QXZ09_09480 [Candidatus Methanomethylicaceae archaeon]
MRFCKRLLALVGCVAVFGASTVWADDLAGQKLKPIIMPPPAEPGETPPGVYPPPTELPGKGKHGGEVKIPTPPPVPPKPIKPSVK